MHLHNMPFRKCDEHGCGEFKASRGDREHMGVDMACPPKQRVFSPVSGRVTKLGYTYRDDPSFRYVQVTSGGYDYRLFYVEPCVRLGSEILYGDVLGHQQPLRGRYEKITEHVHFEIKDGRGDYVDPTPVLVALKGTEGGMPITPE